MWKLKVPSDAQRFKSLLESCSALVTGMAQFEVGIRADEFDANVDVVLVSAFVDAAALAAYQSHPHHLTVSAQLGPLRESRGVLDYQVTD